MEDLLGFNGDWMGFTGILAGDWMGMELEQQ